MAIYPMVEKIEDIFIRFDRMYERDRHTDRQTDGHRMTAKARQKAQLQRLNSEERLYPRRD